MNPNLEHDACLAGSHHPYPLPTYIPEGCTLSDVTEAIEFACFCMNSAIGFIQDRAVQEQKALLPFTEVTALAAPYAQIIEMRLWQLRQKNS